MNAHAHYTFTSLCISTCINITRDPFTRRNSWFMLTFNVSTSAKIWLYKIDGNQIISCCPNVQYKPHLLKSARWIIETQVQRPVTSCELHISQDIRRIRSWWRSRHRRCGYSLGRRGYGCQSSGFKQKSHSLDSEFLLLTIFYIVLSEAAVEWDVMTILRGHLFDSFWRLLFHFDKHFKYSVNISEKSSQEYLMWTRWRKSPTRHSSG